MAFKKIIEKLIASAVKPFVFVWFWFIRWIRYNRFLKGLKESQRLGAWDRPSVLSFPFIYTESLILLIRRIWAVEFAEYALKKYYYNRLAEIHYSKEGRGSGNYDDLSEADCLKKYRELKGRISYYITHNPSILDYKDGDSFLDAGCGMGENIRELVARYPNSSIKGFDISKDILRIIKVALKENGNVRAEVGSIVDLRYLGSYPDKSFDHLIISHVFPFLVGPGIDETRKIRQELIDHFVRIAAKSVLILDGNKTILSENEVPEVIIAQSPRCFFRESVVPYFSKHISKGELYGMFSPINKGVVFKFKNT